MPRATQPITVDQFEGVVPDGQKADLLDGMIYTAPPDHPEAANVNGFIAMLLSFFADTRKLGKVYGPRSAFRLSDTDAPEPDVAFVWRDRLDLWEESIFDGAPDLAVEIVNFDTLNRDPTIKRDLYERAGVREYWMVHFLDSRSTFLRLERKKYRDVTPESGTVFRSEAVPGFWITSHRAAGMGALAGSSRLC